VIFLFKKNNLIKYSIDDIKNKNLIIHHHLGLGDYINCNGIVNYLCSIFDKVIVPLKPNYSKMIRYLYKDNPKVEFLEIGEKYSNFNNKLTSKDFDLQSNYEYVQIENYSKNNNIEILRIGHEKLSMPIPKSFYDQLGLPFDLSFELFNPPYDSDKNNEYESRLKKIYNAENNYSLTHLESSMSNYEIENLKLENKLSFLKIEMATDIYKNIFYYLKVLKKAKEIHLVNSSIFCLADRVETNGKLFLHNINKNKDLENQISWFKNWQIVEYD
tara:strand:- start:4678 stop:5493 length:816 start_codon:yes stop_codon:yes gene_type:complete